MKFPNSTGLKKADVILVGVPDESGSRSYRKGSSEAPDFIRKIASERDVFGERKERFAYPLKCNYGKLHDIGNIKKDALREANTKTRRMGKVPIVLGGDHSITYESLRGVLAVDDSISVIYFDAHPDMVCGKGHYYGSVVYDAVELEGNRITVNLVGTRAVEAQEKKEIKEKKVKVFGSEGIEKIGVKKIVDKLVEKCREKIYISIDVDVVDVAFAPASSTPVPGGLSSRELLYMVNELISKKDLVGMDIVELCPPYDIDGRSAHLCSRLIFTAICSMGGMNGRKD